MTLSKSYSFSELTIDKDSKSNLFALCAAFVFYSLNLINIFEYLSGETYRNTVNNWGKFAEALFVLIVMFGSIGIFGWLSGISKAWTYAVKQMVDLEEAKAQRKRPKKNKKIM